MALASNALTTVAAVATEMGLTAVSVAETAAIERAINAASSAVERYCGRNLGRATLTELVPGYGRARLVLRRTPLVSVTSVSFNGGTAADASTYAIEDADRGFVRSVAGVWGNTADWGTGAAPELSSGTERPLYSVVYVGGFTLPQAGGAYTLPGDLELAAIISATALRRRTGKDTKLADYGSAAILPDAVLTLLEPWRRVA
jgi:hypothetical protein